jgi:hypothetical protein
VSDAQALVPPPAGWLPEGREFSTDFHRLRQAAGDWMGDYYDREHLERAADWLLAMEPGAPEPLVIAVLTHDLERLVPGGPVLDKAGMAWDDVAYNTAHCERSAKIVAGWLSAQGAPDAFVTGVMLPIREHEFGGSPEGNLAQAADSLSWLDVNAPLAARWVERGECDVAKAELKLDWMLERIQVERALPAARPMHEAAVAELRAAVPTA